MSTDTSITGKVDTALKRRDLGTEVAGIFRGEVTATGDKISGDGEVTPTATVKVGAGFLDEDLFELVAKYVARHQAHADAIAGKRRLDFDEETEARDLAELEAEVSRLDAEVTREERALAIENLARQVVGEARVGAVRSALEVARRLVGALDDLLIAIEADAAEEDAGDA